MREIVGRGHAVDTIRFSIFLVKERQLQTRHRDEQRNRQTKQGLTDKQAQGLINGFANPQFNSVRCFVFWTFYRIQIATKT